MLFRSVAMELVDDHREKDAANLKASFNKASARCKPKNRKDVQKLYDKVAGKIKEIRQH